MDEQEIRLKCLELALANGLRADELVNMANFVITGKMPEPKRKQVRIIKKKNSLRK